MIVKDAMIKNFATITPQSSLLMAAELMFREGISTLFVANDDNVIGVIGVRDLFTCPIPASYGQAMPDHTENTLIQQWKDTPVENLMYQYIVSVPEDYPLMTAAALMVNEGKYPLLVKNGKKVVGVIGRLEIINALLIFQQEEESSRNMLYAEENQE